MFCASMIDGANISPLTVMIGHAGSGKTSVSVALALALAKAGHAVTLIDLDVVNPYFRSGDQEDVLTQAGVRVLLPQFSGVTNNLEVPSLPAHIEDAILQAGMVDPQGRRKLVLLDVGGDEIGARVLGRYAAAIAQQGFARYYVLNPYRYQTSSLEAVRENIAEIEQASTLPVTGLIGNPNLGRETTLEMIFTGMEEIKALAVPLNLPLAFYAVDGRFAESFPSALPLALSHPMPSS